MIKIYKDKDSEKYTQDYSVAIEGLCPYCKAHLLSLGFLKLEESHSSYYWCWKCNHFFENNEGLSKEKLGIYYSVRQITENPELKKILKERLSNPLNKQLIKSYKEQWKTKKQKGDRRNLWKKMI